MAEREVLPNDEDTGRSRPVWSLAAAVFCLVLGLGLFVTRGGDEPASAGLTQEATFASGSPAQPSNPGEQVQIPTLGLSVNRPTGWATITADENSRNIRSVQMDDPQFQEMAARYANSPVFAISKYQEPYADLNPSFKINVRPLGGFAKFSPEDILTAAIPTFARAFNDVKVLEGPIGAQVSGKHSAYARLSYTLKANGVSIPTISEIWIVPNGSIFFMIGAGTRADEKNGTRAEMRRILDTVRID
jgi:hypothetical protein